jgi:transketolase
MRAFEHIRTDVGIPDLPVKFIGAIPGFLSEANGPTHQAIEDISLMRGIPSMEVYCPADGVELVESLPHIIGSASPVYVRFNEAPPAYRHTGPFEPGKAETIQEGEDVAILTYGFLVREALRAGEILSARGVSTRVVNLRTLKPIDEEVILSALVDTDLVVVLEDHLITGGLFSIVSELITRCGVRMHNVFPIALPHRWFHPCLLDDVLRTEGFTGELIADRVYSVLP